MGSHYDDIMTTKPFLPFRMQNLTEWMIRKAKEELNETENRRECALEELRSLIATKWDPHLYLIPTAISAMTALILNPIEDPATQVCGVQIIFDVQGACLSQIRQVTPRYMQLISYALRNTLPVRFKGIHIFNESVLFSYLYSVSKIFLTEKIKKRIHFHGKNTKHLQNYVPKEILPAEYDGDNIHFNAIEQCKKEMEPYYERYAQMHRKGYC